MVKANGARSLQDLVDEKTNLVEYFYNDTLAPHYRARTGLTAAFIPPEFTNWRDEQRAWRGTAILFDQTHHMPELMLKGPDAFRLLEKLGINSLSNFTIDRAKQFVACTPRGHVIGDCVVYRLAEDTFELISGMPVLNWVQFNAEQGGYDVTIERDDPTPYNPTGRRWFYRFQLEGPNAGLIFNAAVEGVPRRLHSSEPRRLKSADAKCSFCGMEWRAISVRSFPVRMRTWKKYAPRCSVPVRRMG